MLKSQLINAVDLFAGMGGFSTGAELADCNVLWAGNHWPAAVAIHTANHPNTIHACQDLQQQNWAEVPGHDILLASPACQGHSPARGKEKPHHDALRSTAWAVVSAAECHRPYAIVVENVKEFATKWVLYPAWCAAMQALGYAIAPHLVDAADHGVAQNRLRLFLVLTRSKHPIELDVPKQPHLPARGVINFDAGDWALITDKVEATQARVARGRSEFGQQFVMPYYGGGSGLTGRSLDRPIGTITTKNRWGVVNGKYMRMLLAPETRDFMGFDRSTVLPDGITEATFMLGNGVVPWVARDYINAIRRAA
ncbi:MAG: DNA cytosine methyltransferase [Pseudomonadota bacterium]